MYFAALRPGEAVALRRQDCYLPATGWGRLTLEKSRPEVNVRDTVYREDNSQAWAAEGPHALASLRNLTLGLFRLKNADSIKETTEWVCRDRMRALQFMTT